MHPALRPKEHVNACSQRSQDDPVTPRKPHILPKTTQQPLHTNYFHQFLHLSASSAVKAAGFPSNIEQQQLQVFEKPEWAILPLSYDDGSSLCRACTTYICAAKAMLESGTAVDKVLGGRKPAIDLFFQRRTPADEHNTSNWASALAASFTYLEGPYMLRAGLLAYQLIQWMISPSAENYANLYECQRPTIVQRMIPHSFAIDLHHHPAIRNTLCRKPHIDFITPARGNSINWPHDLDAAVEIDPSSGALNVTDSFETHAFDERNWTYGKEYVEAFPELARYNERDRNGVI